MTEEEYIKFIDKIVDAALEHLVTNSKVLFDPNGQLVTVCTEDLLSSIIKKAECMRVRSLN